MMVLLQRIITDVRRQKKSYLLALFIAGCLLIAKTYYMTTDELPKSRRAAQPSFDGQQAARPFANQPAKAPEMPRPKAEKGGAWAKLADWKAFDDFDFGFGAGGSDENNVLKLKPAFERPLPLQCDPAAAPLPTEPNVDIEAQDDWASNFKKSHRTPPNKKIENRENNRLKIFVVPHSHSDPGWLKTFTEYATDTNSNLDLMLKFMPNNKRMTFQFSETAFFEAWWRRLNDSQKNAVKQLIADGQLELPNGAWTMTDEANPYYAVTIDNIIEGHQFLHDQLDYHVPTVWTNDPFGYGPTNAYLFRKAGVRFHVIHRVHVDAKRHLFQSHAIPFLWQQHFDSAGTNNMLTHVLSGAHYDIPGTCGPNPGVCCQFDFKRLTHYGCGGARPVEITEQNVQERSKTIFDQWKALADKYRSPNVALVMLGDDFRYLDENEWHQQHDNYVKIFDYINSHTSIFNAEVRFGTIGDYWREFMSRVDNDYSDYPRLAGDFFPYSDTGGDYWTGYFTSRPFYKRRDRQVWSRVQASDVALGWLRATVGQSTLPDGLIGRLHADLTQARRDLALFQHHDAITGTSKVHVVKDYGIRLFQAVQRTNRVIGVALTALTAPDLLKISYNAPAARNQTTWQGLQLTEVSLDYDDLDTLHTIAMEPGSTVLVADALAGYCWGNVFVFNSLPHTRSAHLTLQVSEPTVRVLDTGRGGAAVAAQINPLVKDNDGNVNAEAYELVFVANLLPLSLHKFALKFESSQPESTSIANLLLTEHSTQQPNKYPALFSPAPFKGAHIKLRTSRLITEHDPATGLIQHVTADEFGRQSVGVAFGDYTNGNDGPYLFMPAKSTPERWHADEPLALVVQGAIMACTYSFLGRIMHKACIYDKPGSAGLHVHLENTVDLRDLRNNEFVMRLASDVRAPAGKPRHFYTDSLGFHFIKRVFDDKRRLESNYYPMPAAVFLESDSTRLTVLADHPHGVSTPENGLVEIMLDRVSSRDDRKGLGGGQDGLMLDAVPVRSAYTVVLERRQTPADTSRHAYYHTAVSRMALAHLLSPPLALYHGHTPGHKTYVTPVQPSLDSAAGVRSLLPLADVVKHQLPCDYELTALRPLSHDVDSWLLVLHRTVLDCSTAAAELHCDMKQTSLNSVVSGVLRRLGASQVQETTLNGVTELQPAADVASVDFAMQPMDLRTFRFRLKPPA